MRELRGRIRVADAGGVNVGGVVSCTVIVTVDVPTPPRPSFAVKVSVCTPTERVTVSCALLPSEVPPSDQVNVSGSLLGSEPEPASVTAAPAGAVASTV